MLVVDVRNGQPEAVPVPGGVFLPEIQGEPGVRKVVPIERGRLAFNKEHFVIVERMAEGDALDIGVARLQMPAHPQRHTKACIGRQTVHEILRRHLEDGRIVGWREVSDLDNSRVRSRHDEPELVFVVVGNVHRIGQGRDDLRIVGTGSGGWQRHGRGHVSERSCPLQGEGQVLPAQGKGGYVHIIIGVGAAGPTTTIFRVLIVMRGLAWGR